MDVENLGREANEMDRPKTELSSEQSLFIIPPLLLLPGQIQSQNKNEYSRPQTSRNIFDSYEFLNGMDVVYDVSH